MQPSWWVQHDDGHSRFTNAAILVSPTWWWPFQVYKCSHPGESNMMMAIPGLQMQPSWWVQHDDGHSRFINAAILVSPTWWWPFQVYKCSHPVESNMMMAIPGLQMQPSWWVQHDDGHSRFTNAAILVSPTWWWPFQVYKCSHPGESNMMMAIPGLQMQPSCWVQHDDGHSRFINAAILLSPTWWWPFQVYKCSHPGESNIMMAIPGLQMQPSWWVQQDDGHSRFTNAAILVSPTWRWPFQVYKCSHPGESNMTMAIPGLQMQPSLRVQQDDGHSRFTNAAILVSPTWWWPFQVYKCSHPGESNMMMAIPGL